MPPAKTVIESSDPRGGEWKVPVIVYSLVGKESSKDSVPPSKFVMDVGVGSFIVATGSMP